ncbi:methyltransferase domain-containing protein [Modestobacter marinus]|uniref:methyltransferase domain-containing protein n=1 Tax=Modestobacter marinus TaxID=477641 RepID=UPI001C96E13A|nr:methyltransferase domain-containing protein [Modestobacter marinus]
MTGDAATALLEASVDAVFAFECLHDLPHPVDVLSAARRALRPGGVVVVMDEAAEEESTAPGSDVERLLYGFSTLVCLPDARSHRPSAATGTVIRSSTVRDLAQRAGFAAVDADRGVRLLALLPPAPLTRPAGPGHRNVAPVIRARKNSPSA